MDLLHRITDHLVIRCKQAAIRGALARLSGRALADLGLEPGEIAAVARLGARLGPEGGTLGEVVAQVRAARSETDSVADRLFGALERMNARKAEALAYTPDDLDRYREEAYRLRAETIAAFWRSLGHGLVALFRPVKQAALDSGLGRRIRLELVWRRTYRQVRAELASYSDRELNSDLRLARSEIDDIAAEGADERVGACIAANPSFRRAAFGRARMARARA